MLSKILNAFIDENKKEGRKFDFPSFDGPYKIEEKINGNGSMFEREIKSDVVDYFSFIYERIQQLDREEENYSKITWGRIHVLYEDLKDRYETKEEIYFKMIQAIDEIVPNADSIKSDARYNLCLRKIISFYVQDCAIFEKEKNGG